MSSEESREIDAARKRLSTAKVQAASASTNMESAKAMMAAAEIMMTNAQSQQASTAKELEEAGEALVEAEKRWEVIDTDEVPNSLEGNNNRRKVPSSPHDNAAGQASAATGRSHASNADISVAAGMDPSSSNVDKIMVEGCGFELGKIIVEGCGLSEVNGTYNRNLTLNLLAAPRYTKRGQWKGRTVNFVIKYSMRWYLGIYGTNGEFEFLYFSDVNPEKLVEGHNWFTTPPESGWRVNWIVDRFGMEPAPQMKVLRQGE